MDKKEPFFGPLYKFGTFEFCFDGSYVFPHLLGLHMEAYSSFCVVINVCNRLVGK
jgi:hypothetical protein